MIDISKLLSFYHTHTHTHTHTHARARAYTHLDLLVVQLHAAKKFQVESELGGSECVKQFKDILGGCGGC